MTTAELTSAAELPGELVDDYRRDGFVHVPRVLSPADAARFARASVAAKRSVADYHGDAMFTQLVNVWRQDDTLREPTLDGNLAAIATRLAGMPLRLWHDQVLIKEPHNGVPTEFHQDDPYWPHRDSRHALSAWVALVDVPAERGCMSFIPGSHRLHGLRSQDLSDRDDLFRVAPELRWQRRVTVPLRAGDCTFHNSFTAHTANPNLTDDPRVAQVVIYVDGQVRYSGTPHPVTDPLGLTPGDPLSGEHFPAFPEFAPR